MFLKSYWKPILIALIIFYGSLSSGDNLNNLSLINFKHSDKLIHFILYFTLSITLQFSILRNTTINKNHRILLTFILVVSYGLIMEVFQYHFTNTRSAEIFDVIANTLGCSFSFLLYPIFKKLTLSKYL